VSNVTNVTDSSAMDTGFTGEGNITVAAQPNEFASVNSTVLSFATTVEEAGTNNLNSTDDAGVLDAPVTGFSDVGVNVGVGNVNGTGTTADGTSAVSSFYANQLSNDQFNGTGDITVEPGVDIANIQQSSNPNEEANAQTGRAVISTAELLAAQANGATDFTPEQASRIAAVGVDPKDLGYSEAQVSALPSNVAEPTNAELGVGGAAVKDFLVNADGEVNKMLANPENMDSQTQGSIFPQNLGLNSDGTYASTAMSQSDVASSGLTGSPLTADSDLLAGALNGPSNGRITDTNATVSNVPLGALRGVNIDGSWLGIPRKKDHSNPAIATNTPDQSHAYNPATMAYTSVPAYTPKGEVKDNGSRMIFVNGQNTLPTMSAIRAQQLSDATGRPVVALYNQTTGERLPDFADSYIMKTGENPGKSSVDVLKNSVVASAKSGSSLTIVAHSQGGLVAQSALAGAKRELIEYYGNEAAAERALKKTYVETHGSPSNASTPYTAGPNYVHYINRTDAVPTALRGVTAGEDKYDGYGKGAVLVDFDARKATDQVTSHTLPTYLNERGSEPIESFYRRNTDASGSVRHLYRK
jgi:hypothetical protein